MGAWGEELLENDPALDVVERWREWVEDPAGIGYDSAIDEYFEYWGTGVRYGDGITNMEILALVGIHFDKDLSIPKRLKKAGVDAANRELSDLAGVYFESPAEMI